MNTTASRMLPRFAALSLLALCAACAGSERLDPAPARIQGVWHGEALVSRIGAKTNQALPVEFVIAADGRVSGTVGAAQLTNGIVAANRGELGRTLDLATDYIVRGELQGLVIEGESAPSLDVIAPFNLVEKNAQDVHIWGSVTTWDNPSGGKDPIVGAHDLVLRRK